MTTITGDHDVTVDPISHEDVDPNDAAGSVFYNGHKYYFASVTNKLTFEENPSLWVSTPHASMNSARLTPTEDE